LSGIFISYRRRDHPEIVHNIYQQLAKRYGASRVFLDVDRLVGGVRFHSHIREALKGVTVVLVIIGPSWTRLTEEGKQKAKLQNPADYLRLEVEQALESSISLIPIRIAGADLPRAPEVPKSLRGLLKINMLELRPDHYGDDLRRLLRHIDLHMRQPSGRELMKGDDLSGWYQAGPRAAEVVLKDGILIAHNTIDSAGYVEHLVTRTVDFSNFYFHCEFMMEDPRAPLGVKFRVDPSNVTFGGMRGYMVAVGGTDYRARNPQSEIADLTNPRLTSVFISSRVRPGFMLAEAEHEPLFPQVWHKLEIVVKAKSISVWLNRKLDLVGSARSLRDPLILVEDHGSTFLTGAIAFVFYPKAKFRIRNVRLQRLPAISAGRSTANFGRWVHRQMVGNEYNERWQVFQQISATEWLESITEVEGFSQSYYSETARTADYLELQREYGLNKRVVVRLYQEGYALFGPSRDDMTDRREGRWLSSQEIYPK
jgi:hypothetical protein